LGNVGINPKVNNLIKGYRETCSDIIWILDSNVTVDCHVLSDVVCYFEDPRIGLVHHIPCAVELTSPGSFLDGAFLSCAHARMYAIINGAEVASCVVGKSNFYRKKDMEDLGGLAQFGKYLAEDNCVGIAFFNAGKKHQIARDFAYQSMGNVSIHDFITRRIRWIRVRKYTVFIPTLVEPFTECIVCGYIGSFYFNIYYNITTFSFMLFTAIVWFLSDMTIAYAVYSTTPTKVLGRWFRLKFLLAWIVRELITFPIYVWAMAGSTIEWRNQLFKLKDDGSAVPANKRIL
jgi:ceramide glucosyltransferase